ncbi:hypothetical protein mRhiFer1_008926 [Rhinolophus ferrumequinum]|uniref:Uncharacterized protein n=1 Tax=Rhinolophus ferrumequinum TaxID=59479 RepID=A0A7J7TDL7_RHIFE|nr:hypothetical protein mRhiFer1_008926 [Rhinolophus ferrumequinum]
MKSLLKLSNKLAITILTYKGQGQLFRCLLWMPPAHSSRVCHHLAILFQPTQGKNRGPATWCHTHQPATCGSGQASDNDPFSSHTYGLQSMCAQRGLVCTSLPCYAPLSQILKTEARRVNDLPHVNVLEPDVETRCSAEVSNPRLPLFPTDPFFISHCLRCYAGEKKTQVNHLVLLF